MHPFELSERDIRIILENAAQKRKLAQNRKSALFDVLVAVQNAEEATALEFLYAFMPLADLADYEGKLFLQHVRHSLKTKRTMSWGWEVSGQLFLHFVLPYRINNEAIENYRPYFFRELYERVKNLSMAEAILEINHWCHEKATYAATDPRTASPLTVIRAARGRCGEESTLLVAALRSVGIPARQVYVPRWAHTDSNHAWVEAWADGRWHFVGACEPEPQLNMGWFMKAARRAMLIHSFVPSTIYKGPEKVVQVGQNYTELNLLPNYAPVRELHVQVEDQTGKALKGAFVDFQVYNSGSFTTITRLISDELGQAALVTGRGDVLVHASAAEGWGAALAKKGGSDHLVVRIGRDADSESLKFAVPKEVPATVTAMVTEEEKACNEKRLAEGKRIRSASEAAFVGDRLGFDLARELKLADEKLQEVLNKARGNASELVFFLRKAVPLYGYLALELLATMSAKDLVDVTEALLWDHLQGCEGFSDKYSRSEFLNYVLQPRIFRERLRPYRQFFQKEFKSARQRQFQEEPGEIKTWIDTNIQQVDEEILGSHPTPLGTYLLRVGDEQAKKVLFVALARSFGIGSRLYSVDNEVQYLQGGRWHDLEFPARGKLVVQKPKNDAGSLAYFAHFSLSVLEQNTYRTLRFKGLDEEAFDDEYFRYELYLKPGDYRLQTGRRLLDGTVLAKKKDFTVSAGETTERKIIIAKEEKSFPQLGYLPKQISFKNPFRPGKIKLDRPAGKKDLILVWIEPEHEPSCHLLRDFRTNRAQFEKLRANLFLCLGAGKLTQNLVADFPANTIIVEDEGAQNLQCILKKAAPDLPVVVVADGSGMIKYISSGYQIGSAALILQSLAD